MFSSVCIMICKTFEMSDWFPRNLPFVHIGAQYVGYMIILLVLVNRLFHLPSIYLIYRKA
jgi:hypothetical protein